MTQRNLVSLLARTCLAVLAALLASCGPGRTPEQGTPSRDSHHILEDLAAEYDRRPARDGDEGQSLVDYATECEEAIGITIPGFNCEDGTEVPNQGTTYAPGAKCDYPDVLNSECDPGSRFRVLPGRTDTAVAVAHCRKKGHRDGFYGDIAIIAHNRENGAVCYFQALGTLDGHDVPAPRSGRLVPGFSWFSPAKTHATGCTACHDNGAFIRSEYLAQLETLSPPVPDVLPNALTGFDNRSAPLRYVGSDFQQVRSWSIAADRLAPGDQEQRACTSCHRLGISNSKLDDALALNIPKAGTALVFAELSTRDSQAAKNPHSNVSPIWMRKGQKTYRAEAHESALLVQRCAEAFWSSNFTKVPKGCTATPLGVPWKICADTQPSPDWGESGDQCLPSCGSIGGVSCEQGTRCPSYAKRVGDSYDCEQCCGPVVCPAAMRKCGDTCVSLSKDPDNCGQCGNVCQDGWACDHGKCTDAHPRCTFGKPWCESLKTCSVYCP